jgi:hypothetical protein
MNITIQTTKKLNVNTLTLNRSWSICLVKSPSENQRWTFNIRQNKPHIHLKNWSNTGLKLIIIILNQLVSYWIATHNHNPADLIKYAGTHNHKLNLYWVETQNHNHNHV